jgi:signal transduction histidine kinase
LNQEPSIWQLHKRLVLGILSFALESALIAVLLIQRARRRRAEMLLSDRNTRLQESEHSLRQLTAQLIGAQEEERKRIARRLHDDLNQQLADLGISLSKIKRSIPNSMEDLRGDVSSAQNGLLTLSDCLRHVSHELHPGMLELFGLEAALKSHCKEFSLVTSIPVELETDCPVRVPPDVALCAYRIAQESLRNVASHAHASKVLVRLTKSGNVLKLMVRRWHPF